MIIELPAVFLAWVLKLSFRLVVDSVLAKFPALSGLALESSTLLSLQDQPVAGPSWPPGGRCPFVSGRAESHPCRPRSIFGPSAPPLCSLPLSPGLPLCLPLICLRKFPLSTCLFPFISQVPTGTWEVGCAQRLERKLQPDNSKGQCSVDVISLPRPEVVFFFLPFFFRLLFYSTQPSICQPLCESSLALSGWFMCFLYIQAQKSIVRLRHLAFGRVALFWSRSIPLWLSR